MQSKKIFLILTLAFILLLLGAGVAYNALKDKVEIDNLSVYEPPQDDSTGSGNQGGDTPSSDHTHDTGNDQNTNSDQSTTLAPDFTVYDKDGNAVKLSDFRGKPVVLNFWASWCGPCQSEMPDFNEKYGELGDEIHFLMVNLTDSAAEKNNALSLIAQKGYTFPVYYDTDIDAANKYYVSSIPATYFINAQGHLIVWASGAINAETLMRGINMIR